WCGRGGFREGRANVGWISRKQMRGDEPIRSGRRFDLDPIALGFEFFQRCAFLKHADRAVVFAGTAAQAKAVCRYGLVILVHEESADPYGGAHREFDFSPP